MCLLSLRTGMKRQERRISIATFSTLDILRRTRCGKKGTRTSDFSIFTIVLESYSGDTRYGIILLCYHTWHEVHYRLVNQGNFLLRSRRKDPDNIILTHLPVAGMAFFATPCFLAVTLCFGGALFLRIALAFVRSIVAPFKFKSLSLPA